MQTHQEPEGAERESDLHESTIYTANVFNPLTGVTARIEASFACRQGEPEPVKEGAVDAPGSTYR